MQKSFKKLIAAASVSALSLVIAPLAGHYAGLDLVTSAHAEHGGESGHAEGGSKKGGKKYMGGKSKEGHESGDSGHKGSSSHGGGSKTLETTVLQPDSGGHTTGGDAGHKGGQAGMGGPKFMGGGKGGEDHEKEEGEK